MEKDKFKPFTTISFYMAFVTIFVIPSWVYLSSGNPSEEVRSFVLTFQQVVFYMSVLGIILSIISMFSKEKIVKRLFALLVNSAPLYLILFSLTVKTLEEFFDATS